MKIYLLEEGNNRYYLRGEVRREELKQNKGK